MLEQPLDDQKADLEQSLRRMRPAGPAGDVQQIVLRSQLRRQRRWLRTWQAVAAGLGLGLFGALIWPQRMAAPVARTVHMPVEKTVMAESTSPQPEPWAAIERVPAPQTTGFSPDSTENYLILRDSVLRYGLAALPAPRGGGTAAGGPVTVRDWQEDLGLAAPARPADRSFSPLELIFWRGT